MLTIGLSILGGIAVLAVLGVSTAGPLGEAVREVTAQLAPVTAPDAPAEVVAPPESALKRQPSDTPGAQNGVAGAVDVAWATRVAAATGIPVRAIQAYAGVVVAKEAEGSTCHLGWNTLAGVGSVESANGTHDGSTVNADGQVTPAIYGIALDGSAVNRIADTDGGAIDGDAQWDRAVGPMQMIPQTWRNWGTDASGDGVADPQNIDDSALAAYNYLCHGGRDLSDPAQWKAAITSYNDAASYILKVSVFANTIAARAAAA